MRKEIGMNFKCPDCGSTQVNAIVEAEPTITNLAVFGPGGRPDRDIAFIGDGSTYVGYDELNADVVSTVKYKCPKCGREFATRWDVLEHCTSDDGQGIDEVLKLVGGNLDRVINGTYVSGSRWGDLAIQSSEVDDLISANLFDMQDTDKAVYDTVRFLQQGTLYESCEDAAAELGIEPDDVPDETHCIVLGSTGRVLVLS